MSYEIAKNFWKSIKKYPNYPNTKERRLIDLNFILNNNTYIIDNINSILDIGCADGYLLITLREFTNINDFYGYDISPEMIDLLIKRWGKIGNLNTYICDFTKNIIFPKVDLTLSMGMFPYIFEDDDLFNILKSLNTKVLIVRTPCTLKEKNEYINTYSANLKSEYSSIYRTVDNYINLFKKVFNSVTVVRAYPDNIESSFGTKHYFFVCKN